jgi:hypothetical protein
MVWAYFRNIRIQAFNAWRDYEHGHELYLLELYETRQLKTPSLTRNKTEYSSSHRYAVYKTVNQYVNSYS